MTRNNMNKDEAAQVGIGTMIVFIATILVAAVAAGVLIDTSQKLQDKSVRTGNDATEAVGTGLQIVNAWGVVSGGAVTDIYLDVRLAAGAGDIDTENLVFHYTDGTAFELFTMNTADHDADANGKFYALETLRDGDDSFCNFSVDCTTFGAVMNDDDLVRFALGTEDGGSALSLGNNKQVDINIDLPEGGSLSIGFSTPSSYGSKTLVELY